MADDVRLKIGADNTSLEQALNQAESKVNEYADRVEDRISNIGNGVNVDVKSDSLDDIINEIKDTFGKEHKLDIDDGPLKDVLDGTNDLGGKLGGLAKRAGPWVLAAQQAYVWTVKGVKALEDWEGVQKRREESLKAVAEIQQRETGRLIDQLSQIDDFEERRERLADLQLQKLRDQTKAAEELKDALGEANKNFVAKAVDFQDQGVLEARAQQAQQQFDAAKNQADQLKKAIRELNDEEDKAANRDQEKRIQQEERMNKLIADRLNSLDIEITRLRDGEEAAKRQADELAGFDRPIQDEFARKRAQKRAFEEEAKDREKAEQEKEKAARDEERRIEQAISKRKRSVEQETRDRERQIEKIEDLETRLAEQKQKLEERLGERRLRQQEREEDRLSRRGGLTGLENLGSDITNAVNSGDRERFARQDAREQRAQEKLIRESERAQQKTREKIEESMTAMKEAADAVAKNSKELAKLTKALKSGIGFK